MNLKPDLQSIYEQMRQHLLTMPGPAWDDAADSCQYRTKDGNACLVGCLLTDEDAREADRTLEDAAVLALRHFPGVRDVSDFFEMAQSVHDLHAGLAASGDAGDVQHWRETALSRFDAFASKYDLKVPEVSLLTLAAQKDS